VAAFTLSPFWAEQISFQVELSFQEPEIVRENLTGAVEIFIKALCLNLT